MSYQIPPTDNKKLKVLLEKQINKKQIALNVTYLSYKMIQEQSGILPKTLSRINTGKGNIKFSTLEKLCNYLGCQPGDLLRME